MTSTTIRARVTSGVRGPQGVQGPAGVSVPAGGETSQVLAKASGTDYDFGWLTLPTLATVATSGAYADLSGTPVLATVATSGAYADLTGTPTLGTAAARDTGTSVGNVVAMAAGPKLPAVDGSALTGIPQLGTANVFTAQQAGIRGGLIASVQQCMLSSDRTGANDTSNQPIFDAAFDTVTLEADTAYGFELVFTLTRAAGATSHTTALRFDGTAVGTHRGLIFSASTTGDIVGTVSHKRLSGSLNSTTIFTAASTSATENLSVLTRGWIRTSGAGTLIPQFAYSAAPGGAPTILADSYFRIWPVGSGTVTTIGDYWS